jgi:hypothetical protein
VVAFPVPRVQPAAQTGHEHFSAERCQPVVAFDDGEHGRQAYLDRVRISPGDLRFASERVDHFLGWLDHSLTVSGGAGDLVTTHREALQQLRDQLTQAMADADNPRDTAVISRELRAVWTELEALPAANSKAPADEISRRRAARREELARKVAGQ